jgi:hypothetical protein
VIFTLTPDRGVGRFQQAVIAFRSEDYDILRDAFVAKFGEPTGRVLGSNEQYRWLLPRSMVYIQQYSSQFNAGVAALVSREYFQTAGKQREERREKAKRGL